MAKEELNINNAVHMCSFCGVKSDEYAHSMVSGPGGCICQDCLLICVEIIFKQHKESASSKNKV